MSSPGAATPAPDTAAGRAVPGRAPVAPTKDAFSELFEAYGLKHDRAKARQAYQQLEPDEVLHEALVAAATEWRAAHERNDTPTQYRTRLYNWISQEKYLEDPPAPHVDRKADAIGKKKRAPKAAKAPKPKPAPRAAQPAPQPPDEPAEWRRLRVAATSTSEPRDGVTVARFEFEGGASPIVFPIIHTEQRTQGRGREKLAILCRAAARPRIDDTDELLGAEIIALVRSDTIERYHLPDSGPAPACVNDNTDVAVAA